jgi:hypothetical protein
MPVDHGALILFEAERGIVRQRRMNGQRFTLMPGSKGLYPWGRQMIAQAGLAMMNSIKIKREERHALLQNDAICRRECRGY